MVSLMLLQFLVTRNPQRNPYSATTVEQIRKNTKHVKCSKCTGCYHQTKTNMCLTLHTCFGSSNKPAEPRSTPGLLPTSSPVGLVTSSLPPPPTPVSIRERTNLTVTFLPTSTSSPTGSDLRPNKRPRLSTLPNPSNALPSSPATTISSQFSRELPATTSAVYTGHAAILQSSTRSLKFFSGECPTNEL